MVTVDLIKMSSVLTFANGVALHPQDHRVQHELQTTKAWHFESISGENFLMSATVHIKVISLLDFIYFNIL